jgi:hypothetical protein
MHSKEEIASKDAPSKRRGLESALKERDKALKCTILEMRARKLTQKIRYRAKKHTI